MELQNKIDQLKRVISDISNHAMKDEKENVFWCLGQADLLIQEIQNVVSNTNEINGYKY